MTRIRLKNLWHVRQGCLLVAALALVYTGQTHAQSTLTLNGNVQITSCYLRVALGSGATGSGTGATSATFAIPTVQNSSPTTQAALGAALTSVSRFTVGLASAVGATGGCTLPGNWNTAFLTPTPVTTISGRQLLPIGTSTATGVAMELYSFLPDGTPVRTINSYPASGINVSYAGANNTSAQTGLDAAAVTATQTFGVALIKTVGAGTALTSGTINGTVTVSYALF